MLGGFWKNRASPLDGVLVCGPFAAYKPAMPPTNSLPMKDFPLPIDERLPELLAALRERPSAVLVAPPGAGKTTRVPLVLLGEPWSSGKRIILLEPRRLAARAAARRMAQTLGEEVGETVGLRMRLGSRIGKAMRIEVVTEGVFTRLILDDPTLDGVAAVLFDEFHERSLDADFGLALALDAQAGLRADLRLVAMSATLDAAGVATLMGGAPVIESTGRSFPIKTCYLPRAPGQRLDEAAAGAALRALREERGGILIFLPGQAEIRRVQERLREAREPASDAVQILPLHGGLELAEQDRVLRPLPAGTRKLVLATSIAETSLTIADIRVVIDSGTARLPIYEPDIGVTRLETMRASRASVEQRRGRAGRVGPGVCYRLWEEVATVSLPARPPAEILNADLSGLLLDCAAWGVTDPRRLPFLDAPPAGALTEARKLLVALGALDEAGRLTEMGRTVRALPVPPRLARMLIVAASLGAARQAASIAAVIVERGLGGLSVDLTERLESFAREESERSRATHRLAASWARLAEDAARREGRQLPKALSFVAYPQQTPSTGVLLALAYPERIAKSRGKGGEYLLANGRAAALDPVDRLARAPFVAVAEITGRASLARIRLAAAIDEAEIEGWFGDRIAMEDVTTFDAQARALRRRRQRRLGAIVLDSAPLPADADHAAATALAKGIAAIGLKALPWTEELERWRGRVLFLRKAEGSAEGWPDLSDAGLASSVEGWLAPHLLGRTSLSEIGPSDLRAALEALLPWNLRRRLDSEAPPYFDAPSGSRVPIQYGPDGATLAIRVQELFGLTQHPHVAGGRLPLSLHLLSPARRPIQITKDLPGFWRGSWAEVRSQMRGRYPKHAWPEDPLNALATNRAKPRGRTPS
jgi:ATP-dependent helicase HrpB